MGVLWWGGGVGWELRKEQAGETPAGGPVTWEGQGASASPSSAHPISNYTH